MMNTLPNPFLILVLALLGLPLVAAEPELSGQQMVAQAADKMAAHSSLQARVRQRVSLYGRQLSGHGTYQQARFTDGMRLRLELKLPVGDQTTSLQQINDGDYLWIRRDVLNQQRVSVVDLRKVRAAWEDKGVAPTSALVVGGISQLLLGLHESFVFAPPRESSLGNEPIWVVEGVWNKDRATGQGGAAPATNLAHIPDSVTLMLSRDELLPLFPFRVEYHRQSTAPATAGQRETMLSIEFFEVRSGGAVDARYFTYAAGDQNITDDTERFLRE
jgi:hypothetical protein